MKNKILFVFLLLLIFSCSKEQKMDRLSNKIDNIEVKSKTYTKTDWDKLQQELDDFEKYYDENKTDFTEDERRKANNLLGKYYALKAKHELDNMKENIKDAGQRIEGMLETLTDEDTIKNNP